MLSCEHKKTLFFILVAFIFSFSIRLIWVYQFNDIDEFKYNDQFMINTNDGYFWAEGVQDILSNSNTKNTQLPASSAISELSAFLYKYSPFSLETVLFYMPAFFASLIVVPLILIGKSIGKIEVGFIAALLASIAWSYYNRTMVGYYDTDFLNIVFPTVLLWSIIWALKTYQEKYLLFTAIDILLYRVWYPQSYSLEFAFFGLISLYLLFQIINHKNKKCKLYENKEIFYTIELLTLMLLAMMQLEIILRVMLVIGYFMLFRQERWHRHLYIMFLMVLVMFATNGGLDPIQAKLKGYVFKDIIESSGSTLRLHYFTVMQTIREASVIDINTIANRISGNIFIFCASVIGYIWLSIKHPLMLLGLPMIGLGFLSYSGGLRFTIYAVPILALGVGYLIVELSNHISNKISQKLFVFTCTIVILIPNIKHIIEYQLTPVFLKSEVEVLSKIKDISTSDDYVVSWWDYGYPIRYYTGTKTLSDGGKHSGSQNFPTSYALLSNQKKAAKMLRLDVEYTQKRKSGTNIYNMIKDNGYKNSNDFLNDIDSKIKMPKKTRDIYLYLPKRMLEILPTISMFSNIDLMNGKKLKEQFFYKTQSYQEIDNKIVLGENIYLDNTTGQLNINEQIVNVNTFTTVQYNQDQKLEKNIQILDKNSPLNLIYLKDDNSFLIVDNDLYNSMYIQLFLFENYDKELYEAVTLSPLSKVYKLKI